MVATGPGFDATGDPEQVAAKTVEMAQEGSDKLRFGIVKLILEGSIQGFTARLSWS